MSPAMITRRSPFLGLGQLLRSVLLCELEHTAIVVTLSERVSSVFVDDKSHVGMKLQCRSANGRRDWAFDGFGDGGSFRFSCGENQDAAPVENRADAHGDGALGNFRSGREKSAIVFNRFEREFFQTSARREAGIRLIETDVAVAADAENLQIDSAGRFDGAFVAFAVF